MSLKEKIRNDGLRERHALARLLRLFTETLVTEHLGEAADDWSTARAS